VNDDNTGRGSTAHNSYVIVRSWQRSAAAGLARDGTPFRQIAAGELGLRLQRSARLVDAARPRLEAVLANLPGTTNVAYVTDRDGIVLHSVGDTTQIVLFGLSPGYNWSEAAMGTNGAGTALATGHPVSVVGPEHFITAFANCTCTAAPIRDSDGAVIGAIDISSSVDDAPAWRIHLVVRTAQAIEADLRPA
jgi:transcriptional regulator of acetoin/glycerol metabolism